MFCSIWFHQAWCKPVESNHLPLGYRPRPSPFGLACEAEDCRLNWYPFRDSNPGSRFVGPTLWAAKLKGCGAPGAIRTRTSCGLNAVTPASWSTGAWRPPRGIEPGTCCLQGSCSAAELDGRKMNKRLGRPTGAAGSLFLIVHNVKQRDLKRDCHPALAYRLSMMFSENRYPLFGIMLEVQARAQPPARGYAKLSEAEGGTGAEPTRRPGASRALSRSLHGIPRVFTLLPVGGGFSPAAGLIRLS
jgi:hypothetical protein